MKPVERKRGEARKPVKRRGPDPAELIAGMFVLGTLALTAWVALAPFFRSEPVMDCVPILENGRTVYVPVV